MSKRSRGSDVQQVTRIVDEDLGDDVQTQQIEQLLVPGGEHLRQSRREHEAGEVLHEVQVCAAHAEGETFEVVGLSPRVYREGLEKSVGCCFFIQRR